MANQINVQQLMKQAQKLQQQMEQSEQALQKQTFTGKAPSGMVTAVVTGDKSLQELHIKPDLIDPDDPETLEDLVLTAVNNALAQVDKAVEQQVNRVQNGAKFPGRL